MLKDIILKNRSCRRFFEDYNINRKTLEELVDLARLSPSAGNVQPLKYILSCDSEKNAKVFLTLAWAGYLEDWSGPEVGERPSAYIVILGDKELKPKFTWDHSIAATSIVFGAVEKDLAGCILAAIDRKKLRQSLNISDRYEILLVVALGKGKEKIQIDALGTDGDIKYWRDKNGTHHVPKRSLDSIILDYTLEG
ncbi:MAG: nitroreductase family protein [Planctomycetes bacterium]|nr:nitroreductase family protein [Planctomycetota bacterium]